MKIEHRARRSSNEALFDTNFKALLAARSERFDPTTRHRYIEMLTAMPTPG